MTLCGTPEGWCRSSRERRQGVTRGSARVTPTSGTKRCRRWQGTDQTGFDSPCAKRWGWGILKSPDQLGGVGCSSLWSPCFPPLNSHLHEGMLTATPKPGSGSPASTPPSTTAPRSRGWRGIIYRCPVQLPVDGVHRRRAALFTGGSDRECSQVFLQRRRFHFRKMNPASVLFRKVVMSFLATRTTTRQ